MRAHALVFAYLAALAPALLMALTQPVWSLVDEAQHFDFIVQLSQGAYPVVGRNYIAPETLDISRSTGAYRAFYPVDTYPTPDLSDVGLPPDGISVRANAVWMRRHMWQLSHESVQTPGYYVAMVPVWWVADHVLGATGAIYVLRILNALLLATLAPMALAVARIAAPGRAAVASLCVLFAALLPGLDLNGTRISNDALATALGGLVVLLAVRWAGAWTWRRTVMIGLLFGAALMVKITDAGLFVALAISALWPRAGSPWSSRLLRAAAAGAIAVACLAPWFVINLASYGALTPGALADRWSDAVPGPLTGVFVVLDLAVFVLTYWTGEPWGALPLAGVFAILGGLVALTVPVAAYRLRMNRAVAVCVAAVGGMVVVSLLLPVAAHYEFVGPGRYVYPALPAVAVLCALGVSAVLASTRARLAFGVAYGALAATLLVGGAAGLPSSPSAGAGVPPAAASILPVDGSGSLDGVTITVDRIAVDGEAGATWLHVTLANSRSDEIEWTVPPVVSAGSGSANGDYRRSSRLPGDVDAGQSVTGWLYVPMTVDTGQSMHVRFTDVAMDGYKTVGDIVIDVAVPAS